jgi:hypothetical protein
LDAEAVRRRGRTTGQQYAGHERGQPMSRGEKAPAARRRGPW